MDLLPPGLPVLTNLATVAEARQWLRELPKLIDEVRAEFDLRLHPPLPGGSCSWVAPAELADGTPVIVKIGWPHREMLGEPAALRLWAGNGAVRLIANDPRRHALILAPCVPGVELGRTDLPPTERLEIAATVLRQLWSAPLPLPPRSDSPASAPALSPSAPAYSSSSAPADSAPATPADSPPTDTFERLADVTAEWADLAEARMARLRPGYDPALVAEGITLLRELPATATREVLLHGDINPGNILSAGTSWLAIDPKPMRGDAAYDPLPLLEQIDDPFSYAFPAPHLRDRLHTLAHSLQLPPERIVAWSIARMTEDALYTANQNNIPAGAERLTRAHTLATLKL